jgi:hypothetical protein
MVAGAAIEPPDHIRGRRAGPSERVDQLDLRRRRQLFGGKAGGEHRVGLAKTE